MSRLINRDENSGRDEVNLDTLWERIDHDGQGRRLRRWQDQDLELQRLPHRHDWVVLLTPHVQHPDLHAFRHCITHKAQKASRCRCRVESHRTLCPEQKRDQIRFSRIMTSRIRFCSRDYWSDENPTFEENNISLLTRCSVSNQAFPSFLWPPREVCTT
jgi:hypothetical protein